MRRCESSKAIQKEVRWKTMENQILIDRKHCYESLLGGGFKYIFYVHPYLGKISNVTNIFQMGWNHQLVLFASTSYGF